jgi:queuine tRNA-ribosyltransferase
VGLAFELLARDGPARRGRLETAHGVIDTPAFMPVGTAATVKAMTPEAVAQTGAQIVLANAYHLMLRPTAERIDRLGGLHKFMNWAGPILTDSGGFQAMSLAQLREISDAGIRFKSHLDGSMHDLTPERCMEVQTLLGVDIAMALDECVRYPASEEEVRTSLRYTLDWGERSRAAFVSTPGRGLFGIVQGETRRDLREACANQLTQMGFDGYAIGGLAVGEGQKIMFEVVGYTAPLLPEDRPRYLMGVGKPGDIVGAVARGVDMFDCVLPTRSGRTGQAFTRRGTVNIRNARHAEDARALDADCTCPVCRGHSRAYLHHLSKAEEILGAMLLTWHNIHYYQELMADLRGAIAAQSLAGFSAKFDEDMAGGDITAL